MKSLQNDVSTDKMKFICKAIVQGIMAKQFEGKMPALLRFSLFLFLSLYRYYVYAYISVCINLYIFTHNDHKYNMHMTEFKIL